MGWTKILSKKEKIHLRENVTILTGMREKAVVIELLRKCDCPECKQILSKLEGN